MAEVEMVPRAPFAGLPIPAAGDGVVVQDLDGLGIASVQARRGQAAALAARVQARFGVTLPDGPRRSEGDGVIFAGTGVGIWLAVSPEGWTNHLHVTLREALGDLAAITDQSDGYAMLRLGGPRLRDTLAKGVAIDPHPAVFKIDDVAATSIAHIGATLWRIPDSPDGSPRFEVAVFRSLAVSFWDWLSESAAEFGMRVDR